MGELRSLIVSQADILLCLHGLALMVVAAASLALARLDRSGLPWRAFALFAVTWGVAEWLEMVFLGVSPGDLLPVVQMVLVMVALLARAEFGRAGMGALGGRKLGRWVLVAFGVAGVSGVFGGIQNLWISLDLAASLGALWGIWVLARYRSACHPGSISLLVCLGSLGLYSLGTAIPVLHITWFLPGVAGGFPEGQLLWIGSMILLGLGLLSHYVTLWRSAFPDRRPLPPGLTGARISAFTLLILLAGWGAVIWGGQAIVGQEKENLLHKAKLAAVCLDGDLLRQLEGIPEDSAKPAFQSLRLKIMTAVKADPKIRFIYALIPRGGRLYFTLDSSSLTSRDYSPPGMPYDDAPPGVAQVFSEGRTTVIGPFTDHWGTFMSAFVPVREPSTARVFQVVGVDMNFSDFTAKVAGQRLVFILMTLLVALVELGALSFLLMARESAEGRRLLEAQMMEAQKLESLGVLAGGIAHDFNNILQGILGNADLALRTTDPASPIRKRLAGILDSSRRAADLCKLMLAYSGKGSFSIGRLDLGTLVRETVQILEASIPKKISVVFNLAPDLPCVEGDASQVRQLVMNLLLNASDAIGEKAGTITVELQPAPCPEEPAPPALPRSCVLLQVADTGCGMDGATRSRIFEPFFTTKFAGRGLGLAAVQGIVRGHKGTITVESSPGAGTTFRVTFPACETPVSDGDKGADSLVLREYSGRVLLVDDEADIREVGAGMLEHLGFRVGTAGGGRATLELLRSEEPFDLVVLDMTMPEVDGAETLRQIRELRPDLPVILMSGYDKGELARRFSVEGQAGFLHKPFSLDSLSKSVAGALGIELRVEG